MVLIQTPDAIEDEASPVMSTPSLLAADQPITSPSEDRLRRSGYACQTARALQRDSLQNSLIVALLGRWGSGKTSLLNLIEYYLVTEDAEGIKRAPGSSGPIIVRFNPWLFADQNQLSSRFFRAISLAFQAQPDKDTRRLGFQTDVRRTLRIASAIEEYAKILEPLYIFGSIGRAATTGSRLWAAFLRQRGSRFGDDLEALKAHINQSLEELGRRVVVMIDDIDRLNAVEIAQVFQLARLMGDFVNTAYVLAFDRRLIASALGDVQKIDGNEYLEKIVHISLDVPAIPRRELHTAAETALRFFIDARRAHGEIAEERFKAVFDYAASNFLRTPRNVSKLFSTFRFHLVLLEQERDPVDLLAITVLQVFLPDLYEVIRDKLDRFYIDDRPAAGHGGSAAMNEEDRASMRELIKAGASGVPLNRTEEFLSLLFPRVSMILGADDVKDGILQDLKRRRGIGHREFADAYFAFALPSTEFSEKRWEDLLREIERDDEKTSIEANADKFLLQIAGNDPLSFFDRVRDDLRDAPAEPASHDERWRRMARFLWVVGDRVVFQTNDMRQQSEVEAALLDAIESLLIAHGDDNMRHGALQASYRSTHPDHVRPRGLYIPCSLLMRLRRERGMPSELGSWRYPSVANRKVIGSDGHFKEIESHAVTLVQNWLKAGSYIDPRALIDVLATACDLGARRSVAEYLNALMERPDGIMDFLIAFVTADARYSALGAGDAVTSFLQGLSTGIPGEVVSFDALGKNPVSDASLDQLRRHIFPKLVTQH
jgi:predicted KAP-like P-loop ATPase